MSAIPGYDEVFVGGEQSLRRELIVNPRDEPPPCEINRIRPGVIEFNIAVVIVARNRLVHDFIDNHFTQERRMIRYFRRGSLQWIELIRTIGISTGRNIWKLIPEL